MCREIASDSAMRSDFPTRRAPASWALASVRFGTPGDHRHVERGAIASHAAPEPSKTDDAERLAGEAPPHRNAALKAAGPHGCIGSRDGADGGDHEAKGQFCGRKGSARAAAGGVAHHDSLAGTGREVQGRDTGSGDADHPQFGQAADERLWKGGALPHGEQNVEIGKCGGRLVLGLESVGKECQVSARGKRGPVGAFAGDVLPVIENRDFGHHDLLFISDGG